MKTKSSPLYIANGKFFISYEKVEEYAKENGWRISNTEKVKGPRNNFPDRVLVTLEKA